MRYVRLLILSGNTSPGIYEALLLLAFILILGLFAGRWFEKLKLPHITGYISIGIILGLILSFLGVGNLIDNLVVISRIALGLYIIGVSLSILLL